MGLEPTTSTLRESDVQLTAPRRPLCRLLWYLV